jgi:hypothetical protein
MKKNILVEKLKKAPIGRPTWAYIRERRKKKSSDSVGNSQWKFVITALNLQVP